MSKGYCYDMCDFDQEFFPDGITNGAKWYVISGGMQDWNYENSNCFEITIELGCQKYPSADKLPEYWSKNFNSIMGLIQSAVTVSEFSRSGICRVSEKCASGTFAKGLCCHCFVKQATHNGTRND